MKDRNHLAQVTTVADVNIIDNGIIDIPMLQILDENGKATPEATLPDISQAQALKIHETMANEDDYLPIVMIRFRWSNFLYTALLDREADIRAIYFVTDESKFESELPKL